MPKQRLSKLQKQILSVLTKKDKVYKSSEPLFHEIRDTRITHKNWSPFQGLGSVEMHGVKSLTAMLMKTSDDSKFSASFSRSIRGLIGKKLVEPKYRGIYRGSWRRKTSQINNLKLIVNLTSSRY